MEVDVLQELPVETLYLALKAADPESALWFYQNATPAQVQGLIDIDCWEGSQFLPERAAGFFKDLSRMEPLKLLEYMKSLDPEFIVRTLMEFCDVVDTDPQNPPELPENAFLLSPDNKYMLILKTQDPSIRDSLYHWLNKLSAASLELMRRHLESCKWEQVSDLEEFSYQIKKGRLEDMGFVDYHEAIALYAFGSAAELKKKLLENPISKNQKLRVRSIEDAEEEADPTLNEEWLPSALADSLHAEGFLAKALAEIKNTQLREILLQEIIRTINAALSADKVLHLDIESIRKASVRSRKYMDLGLSYISQGSAQTGAQWLETQPLSEIYRLGWLVVQDLQRAVKSLSKITPLTFFGEADLKFLQDLNTRHPEIDPLYAKELAIPAGPLVELSSVLKVGERLAQLGWVQKFFLDSLEGSLEFSKRSLAPHESAYARLATLLFRQSLGDPSAKLSSEALTLAEWVDGAPKFNKEAFNKACMLIVEKAHEAARPLILKRMQSIADDTDYFCKNSASKIPDPRFFKGLVFASSQNVGDAQA
jgi:hypothetical protein